MATPLVPVPPVLNPYRYRQQTNYNNSQWTLIYTITCPVLHLQLIFVHEVTLSKQPLWKQYKLEKYKWDRIPCLLSSELNNFVLKIVHVNVITNSNCWSLSTVSRADSRVIILCVEDVKSSKSNIASHRYLTRESTCALEKQNYATWNQ